MKTFLFCFLIPALSGAVTALHGISILDEATRGLWLKINLPICALSVIMNTLMHPKLKE